MNSELLRKEEEIKIFKNQLSKQQKQLDNFCTIDITGKKELENLKNENSELKYQNLKIRADFERKIISEISNIKRYFSKYANDIINQFNEVLFFSFLMIIIV